ncbi:hypothetical protein OBBRIDRAFT_807601 [Obba rivulosa]|uniref:Uncharacterized protein n=1 Tax=Obba rivulosa TaxID=1052685 RepID=A0A8E2DFV9_9APHY|nr:hypothetical protein OBBRIDRAFT_807601 [Obba rivulosa]
MCWKKQHQDIQQKSCSTASYKLYITSVSEEAFTVCFFGKNYAADTAKHNKEFTSPLSELAEAGRQDFEMQRTGQISWVADLDKYWPGECSVVRNMQEKWGDARLRARVIAIAAVIAICAAKFLIFTQMKALQKPAARLRYLEGQDIFHILELYLKGRYHTQKAEAIIKNYNSLFATICKEQLANTEAFKTKWGIILASA